jgi:hypothetical protein
VLIKIERKKDQSGESLLNNWAPFTINLHNQHFLVVFVLASGLTILCHFTHFYKREIGLNTKKNGNN